MTSDVTVTSFQMGSTLNLDTTSARYSGRRMQSFASLSIGVKTIGVDLYTFVGARAPTMLSWATPRVLWAPTTKVGTGITVTVL